MTAREASVALLIVAVLVLIGSAMFAIPAQGNGYHSDFVGAAICGWVAAGLLALAYFLSNVEITRRP